MKKIEKTRKTGGTKSKLTFFLITPYKHSLPILLCKKSHFYLQKQRKYEKNKKYKENIVKNRFFLNLQWEKNCRKKSYQPIFKI